MAHTLATPSPETHLNSIQATSQGPLTGVNRGHEMLKVIDRARTDLGLKQQVMAVSAGVKESQFSTALNGSGNFAVTWLWAQSDLYILKYVERLLEARGLTPENAKAVKAFRMLELIKLITEDAP